jgi:uncharacterized protein (TIGR02246 family)
MTSKLFPTPQDCEAAFYEALEKADLDLMMSVWSEDEEVVCIHPGGARLAGHAAIREAWRQMFAGGPRLTVHVGQLQALQSMMMVTHSVHEFISARGESRPAAPVVATNVYMRSGNGWKMVMHHASPSPKLERSSTAARPKTLH